MNAARAHSHGFAAMTSGWTVDTCDECFSTDKSHIKKKSTRCFLRNCQQMFWDLYPHFGSALSAMKEVKVTFNVVHSISLSVLLLSREYDMKHIWSLWTPNCSCVQLQTKRLQWRSHCHLKSSDFVRFIFFFSRPAFNWDLQVHTSSEAKV